MYMCNFVGCLYSQGNISNTAYAKIVQSVSNHLTVILPPPLPMNHFGLKFITSYLHPLAINNATSLTSYFLLVFESEWFLALMKTPERSRTSRVSLMYSPFARKSLCDNGLTHTHIRFGCESVHRHTHTHTQTERRLRFYYLDR